MLSQLFSSLGDSPKSFGHSLYKPIVCVAKAVSQTCVPGVCAARPGKLRVEREEEIEESPGQYDNVVDTGV